MEDPGREQQTAKVTEELAREVASYAQGAGPAKEMLRTTDDVNTFHRAGLMVHSFVPRIHHGFGPAPTHRNREECKKSERQLAG